MEYLKLFIPIFSALLTGIFAQPFIGLITSFQKRRLKKILDINDSHQLFEKYDTDFKEKFILPDLKENYFYLQTGIYTNEKSIDKYINLKNKVGKDFNWENIKTAKEHFDLNGEEIKIKLNKFKKISSNIILIASLLSFGLSLYVVAKIGPDFIYFSKNDYYKFFLLVLVPFALGYAGFSTITSILMAKSMEKTLINLASGDSEHVSKEALQPNQTRV